VKYGSATKPVPGYDIRIFSDEGKQLGNNELGNIVIKLPLPPGSLTTLFKNDKRYIQSYLSKFEGYYLSGDAGYIDDDGYVFIMSRIDDVINVSGVRLSTGAIEEVISAHQSVAECCVVGPDDEMKGQVPVAFIVLKVGNKVGEEVIKKEIIQSVKDRIGGMTGLKKIGVLKALPKTRSGKILRGVIKQLADGLKARVPPTIEDEETLQFIIESLKNLGYNTSQEQIQK